MGLISRLKSIPDPRSRHRREYPLHGLLSTLVLAAAHNENSFWLAGAAFSWKLSVSQAARLLRGHWSIENGVFYVRDVTMDEDRWPGRKIGYPLSNIRNAALNLLRTLAAPHNPDARRHLAARPDLGLPLIC